MKFFPRRWLSGKIGAMRIYSKWALLAVRTPRRRRANAVRIRRAKACGGLHVQLDTHVGLFAHLTWALKIATYCERHGIPLYVTCTSRQYGGNRGCDWFNHLFRQPHATATLPRPARARLVTIRINEFEEFPWFSDPSLELSLAGAMRVREKYFAVAPGIIEKADAFARAHFSRGPVVGCHYRGTDKSLEAARINYAEMAGALAAALEQQGPLAALFIATDEAAFLEHVRAAFPMRSVISADHERSTDGRALHNNRRAARGLRQAEEALIDSLLLSRCAMLVKTPSTLSAWSKMFNPGLPVRFVGRANARTSYYPENLMLP